MGIKHNVFQVHLCCNTYHYFIPLCGWIKFSIIFSRSEGSWTWVFQRASAIVQGKVNVSQFSCSVMSDSLQPHGLQHTRLLCPSPTPTQTHVHWVSDAIQPSHPLSSPSPPTFNLSQYQGLFQWVSSSHQVAKVLEFQLQHQSFQWTPRTRLL